MMSEPQSHTRHRVCFIVPLAATIPGCSAPVWDGTIRQWGSLRAVWHDGEAAGRTRIDQSLDGAASAWGIGAIADLRGEIVVVDGVPWLSETDGAHVTTLHGDEAGERRAPLLALTDVPAWATHRLTAEVPAADFDDFIAERIDRSPWRSAPIVPFVISGPLRELHAHVLAGQCPVSGKAVTPDARPPLRVHRPATDAALVGFFAPDAAGRLTHHRSRTHVHVLLPGDPPMVAHVDAVTLAPGGLLRLPAARGRRTTPIR